MHGTVSSWQMIHEVGSGEPVQEDGTAEPMLTFPTFVGRMDDGSTLISEEIGIEKQVPFRFECRTLHVGGEGKGVLDSGEVGWGDSYGCPMSGGRIALLRRTTWQLRIVDSEGLTTHSIGLARFSKKLPRFANWTAQGTFLVAFYNRSFDVDLIEIDSRGNLLWCLPEQAVPIGIIGNAQRLPAGTILLADPFCHVVLEIDRCGEIVWSFGESGHPAADERHLSSPSCAVEALDGRRFVADTRNHRILVINQDGSSAPLELADTHLTDPTSVCPLPEGGCLIADTGNSRVIELDANGKTVALFGATPERTRILSYPRSVDAIPGGGYLIADTAHDRIVIVHRETVMQWPFHCRPPLFWPRCVRLLPSGSLLVADARNGRIIEVGADGRVLREVSHLSGRGGESFHDPHDVRSLPDDRLLVTDSTHDVVLEVDWDGCVHRVIGRGGQGLVLDDPHSAQLLEDRSVLISDTGNNRIVHVDESGVLIRQWTRIDSDGHCHRLHQPRYVEAGSDGMMAIADTGNNRILAATLDGRLVWEFSRVPDSGRPFLNQPRWVKLLSRDEIVVCDHFHHRIVHVRRSTIDQHGE